MKKISSLLIILTPLLWSAASSQAAVITASSLGSSNGSGGLTVNNVSLGSNEALIAFVSIAQNGTVNDPTVEYNGNSFTKVLDATGGDNEYGWIYSFTGSGTNQTADISLSGGSQYTSFLVKVSGVDTSNLFGTTDFDSGATNANPVSISNDLGTFGNDSYVLSVGYGMAGTSTNYSFTGTPSGLSQLDTTNGNPNNQVLASLYEGSFASGATDYTADWTVSGDNTIFRSAALSAVISPVPEPSATVLLLGALGAGLLFRRRRA